MNRAIFIQEVDLHDLHLFLHSVHFLLHARLVSGLGLLDCIELALELSALIDSVGQLLLGLVSHVFDLLGHLMPQSGLLLCLLSHLPVFLRVGCLDLHL